MEVKKKTWPKWFKLMKSGKKKWDIRLGDFEVHEGDTLVLKEWDPEKKEYTGREIRKKIKELFRIPLLEFYDVEELLQHGLFLIEMEDEDE